MPITNGTQSVGTAASQINGVSVYQSRIIIHNNDTTKDLFIGGENVNTSNGIPVGKLQYIEVQLPPMETLYMVSSGSSHSVSWMKVEQD